MAGKPKRQAPASRGRGPQGPAKPKGGGTKAARGPKPPARAAPLPPAPVEVSLPAKIVDDWADALIRIAKPPRGTRLTEMTVQARLELMLRTALPAIRDLWRIYNEERSDLSARLLTADAAAAAYLAGFHLPNVARAWLALQRADLRHDLRAVLRGASSIVWHDIGGGSGALSHAGAAWLDGHRDARFHVYDASGALLDAATAILTPAVGATAERPLRTHKVRLDRLEMERCDRAAPGGVTVWSLGYVWNELGRVREATSRLLKGFRADAASDRESLLVILEPAQQEHARAAMALRDELVHAGWRTLYPCPASSSCPMRQRNRDWCYSEGRWRMPKPLMDLDRKLGTDRSKLNAAMYIFATPALARRLRPAALPGGVVVGRPEAVPGKTAGKAAGKTSGKAAVNTPGRSPRAAVGKTDDRSAGAPVFDYLICQGGRLRHQSPAPKESLLLRGVAAPQPDRDLPDRP